MSIITGHLPRSPDIGADTISVLLPKSSTSPVSCKRVPRPLELEKVVSLTIQQSLGSTDAQRYGNELLLSSCESVKTICETLDASKVVTNTPFDNMEKKYETERDSGASTELTEDEALKRPDILKGIQSFQKSHSDLVSLGLAFPAQNSSMAIGRWPSVADRPAPSDDWESYTYSPGYNQAYDRSNFTTER